MVLLRDIFYGITIKTQRIKFVKKKKVKLTHQASLTNKNITHIYNEKLCEIETSSII